MIIIMIKYKIYKMTLLLISKQINNKIKISQAIKIKQFLINRRFLKVNKIVVIVNITEIQYLMLVVKIKNNLYSKRRML